MKATLVMVTLEDSHSSDDKSLSELLREKVCIVNCLGFLVHENKSRVVLANWVGGSTYDSLTIPRKAILKIVELEYGKVLFPTAESNEKKEESLK